MVERLRGQRGVDQRRRRLLRTNGLCGDCLVEGRYVPATVVDHIVPLSKGGSDEDDNTRNLCHEHDKVRTAEQFGHKLKQVIGVDGWPTN